MKAGSWCPLGTADCSRSRRRGLAQPAAVLAPHLPCLQPGEVPGAAFPLPERTNVAPLQVEQGSSGAVTHPSLCADVCCPAPCRRMPPAAAVRVGLGSRAGGNSSGVRGCCSSSLAPVTAALAQAHKEGTLGWQSWLSAVLPCPVLGG